MGMTKNIMERKLTEEQVKKFKLLLIEDEKLLRGIQHCLFCAVGIFEIGNKSIDGLRYAGA